MAKKQEITTQNQAGSSSEDFAVWMRYAGMSRQQAKEFRKRAEDLLDEIAPNAYGVSAAGQTSHLPTRIQQAIESVHQTQPKKLSS